MKRSYLAAALLWILLLVPIALCDVQITYPDDDEELSFDLSGGSVSISVEWDITDYTPTEDDIESYTFTLVAGPNDKIVSMGVLGSFQAAELEANEVEFEVANTVGSNGRYMIQVLALAESGYTIHYTPRFELVGMTGTEMAPTAADIEPPGPERKMFENLPPIEIDSRSFTVPYRLQTGRAKFAPMQTQPPTRVTMSQWRRIHETSAVTYFLSCKTWREQMTTITPGWSYILPSGMNYATPAPMPSANGGWHDPKRRLSMKPRKLTTRMTDS